MHGTNGVTDSVVHAFFIPGFNINVKTKLVLGLIFLCRTAGACDAARQLSGWKRFEIHCAVEIFDLFYSDFLLKSFVESTRSNC